MKRICKFTVIADTHYYDASLGTTGAAYALRSASDQKCLAETDAILDAAFQELASDDTQAVLLAGDVTNDGERVCHEKMLEKLYALAEKKPVYVTTATHDWCCDQNPRCFDGDKVYHTVETVSHEQLFDLYKDFGVAQARKHFVTHLGTASYVVDLAHGVCLLALIDDQNGAGKAGYTPEHLQWILKTIQEETAAGKTVIGMQHHLLYPHISPLLTKSACCGDCETLATLLSDAGLRFMFVGHSHLQRIDRFVSANGNELFEINVGALSGYPAPMVEVEVFEETVRIQTKRLKNFVYQGKTVDAQLYLRTHAAHLIGGVLNALLHDTDEQVAKRLSAFGADGDRLVHEYGTPLRAAAKRICTQKTGTVGRWLNRLPGGAFFDKADLQVLQNVPVTDFVYDVLFAALSGDPLAKGKSAAYARVFAAAGEIPARVLAALHVQDARAIAFCKAISEAAWELRTGGSLDNQTLCVSRWQA